MVILKVELGILAQAHLEINARRVGSWAFM